MRTLQPSDALAQGLPVPPAVVSRPDSNVLTNMYAALCSWLIALFLFNRFVLEPSLPRFFGQIYARLAIKDQRSFTCHINWLTIKGVCLIGMYPLINIVLREQPLTAPLSRHGTVSNGDVLSMLFAGIISGFIWEITYRLAISPVSLIHHLAAIVLSAWQVSSEVYTQRLDIAKPSLQDVVDNATQFRLIMLGIYGAFEVVFESWLHVACVLYRVKRDNPLACAKIWGRGAIYVLAGSLLELAVMIAFWTRYWHLWPMTYRVLMPILHLAFMLAQLHGARIGFQLRRRFLLEAQNKQAQEKATGAATIHVEDDSLRRPSITVMSAVEGDNAAAAIQVQPSSPREEQRAVLEMSPAREP